MSDVNFTSNHKVKVLAVGVAIVLHGLAGFGLANMSLPELKPLKNTPPIEIQIIQPTQLNNLESPEPPKPIKPIAAPKVEVNPDPRPAPAKPKMVEPPKNEPKKTEPKQVQKQEKKIEPDNSLQQEANRQAEILAKQRADAQAKWEAEQKAEIDRQNREKAAAEAAAKAREEAAAAKARAEAEAAAKAKNGNGNGDNKNDQGRGTGNVIGEMTISAAKANASWKRKPNWSNIDVQDAKVKTVSFTVHLQIDEKGRITGATGVSTGLGSRIDKQIEKALRAASFHPFKDEQGNPVRGKVNLPMNFTINN